MKKTNEQCPICQSKCVEKMDSHTFRLTITNDRRCTECGAVWRPPTADWGFVGIGGVLAFFGTWELLATFLRAGSVTQFSVVDGLVGVSMVLLGAWIIWRGFQAKGQIDVEYADVQAGTSSIQPPGVVSRPQHHGKTHGRRWFKSKLVQFAIVALVGLAFLVGEPPKDRYGRPMKLERRGRFFEWVENPAAPMPRQNGSQSLPLDAMIRRARETSENSAGESKNPQSKAESTNMPFAAEAASPKRNESK